VEARLAGNLTGLYPEILRRYVEVYAAPTLAYEVEFVNPDGSTRALLTLAPSQVRRLSPADVLTTRQMALAA